MKLIIAEKHKVAEYIADSLPDKAQNKSGYIESGEYCITWAAGHLLTLCEPKDYDEAYGKWDLSALPIFFEDWKHKIADSGGRGDNAGRLNVINSLMDRSDCLIHAGDTDDEGQCLIDEIIDWFDYKKPVYRLDTNDTTVAGLQKAMARIDDNDLHVPDGLSAYARSVADLMVGVNLSRYFSLKNFPAKLIVGRVQTPTLGLVVDRDLQIENHVKQVYYTIFADMKVDEKIIRTKYTPDSKDPNLDNGKFTEKSSAQNKVDMLSDETISGVEIKTVIEDEQPPLPFNLSELQLYCSQKFGYGLNDVMEITQRLRDDHNAISYNRTDCQYLNENQFGEAAETLDYVAKNLKFRPKQLDPTIKSRCFDDKVTKETAHTAIIPLATDIDLADLDEKERNVYLAICKYYMIQFMPPAKKRKTRLSAKLKDGGKLTASSVEVVEEGYLALFRKDKKEVDPNEEPEERSDLSSIPDGKYVGDIVSAEFVEKETTPPKRYTQGTLAKDMTRISKYVDDPEVKKLLLAKDYGKKGENGSIGTEATRAPIVQNLIDRGFLEEKGKQIISTALGRELCRILPKELVKPNLTAYWWVIQEDIKKGKATPETLTDNVLEMIKRIIRTDYPSIDLEKLPESAKFNSKSKYEEVGTCPVCGKPVIVGKVAYGCSGWRDGCQFKIWKKPKGELFKNTSFSVADAKKLLAGKTVTKKKLVSKKGTLFEADLKLKDVDSPYGASFEFVFKNDKKGAKKKT